jgi:hypothetical protein
MKPEKKSEMPWTQVNSFSAMPWLILLPSRPRRQQYDHGFQIGFFTCSYLSCGRSTAVLVEMRHVLTEQLVKKVLSQGACRPSCGDTDAKSTQIPNNETGGEYVQEVEYQAVNGTSKGRAVLACCLLIEFCG